MFNLIRGMTWTELYSRLERGETVKLNSQGPKQALLGFVLQLSGFKVYWTN